MFLFQYSDSLNKLFVKTKQPFFVHASMNLPEGSLSEFGIRAKLHFKNESHISDSIEVCKLHSTFLNVLRCSRHSDANYVKQGEHHSIVSTLESLLNNEHHLAQSAGNLIINLNLF